MIDTGLKLTANARAAVADLSKSVAFLEGAIDRGEREVARWIERDENRAKHTFDILNQRDAYFQRLREQGRCWMCEEARELDDRGQCASCKANEREPDRRKQRIETQAPSRGEKAAEQRYLDEGRTGFEVSTM